ncbi:unnamed protein product [Rotaria socialis]
MSTTNKSHLAALPIEVIYQIFDYLDVETILFSIRCVSKQLYSVATTYNRYELDFRYIFQSDLPVIARIINPENVVSITISDELCANNQVNLFFSHFRIDQFIRLHSLNLIKVEAHDLNKFKDHIMKCSLRTFSISLDRFHNTMHMSLISSILSHRDLYNFEFKEFSNVISEMQWPNQCSLKHVTIYECHLETIYHIITRLPYLQTLAIENFCNNSFGTTVVIDDSDTDLRTNLTSLLLNRCTNIRMNHVEALLSRLPALKHLRLLVPRCEYKNELFDGSRWEEFIRSKLSLLNKFEFSFHVSKHWIPNDVTIESLIAPFRTPFWLESKHWCIKCDLEKQIHHEAFHLYSLPLFQNYFSYPEYRNRIRYSILNVAENSANIIANTSELFLELNKTMFSESHENVNSTPSYFFQNVKILSLIINQIGSVDLIEYISTVANLSSLEKLTLVLWPKTEIISFNASAKILFNQASNLRSIEIVCDFDTIGMIFMNDILSNLPRYVKHLETSIQNVEHAIMMLERTEYLQIAKFQVTNANEFWNHITQWLSQSGRKATIKSDSLLHRYVGAPPISMMYLWFSKSMNKQRDTSVKEKRMKLMHTSDCS